MTSLRPTRTEAPGALDPGELVDARKQLHQAVQISGAVGNSLVPEQDDDTHTTLFWSDDYGALMSRDTPHGFHVGLSFDGPALIAVNERGLVSQFELDGQTLENAWTWVKGAVAEAGGPKGVDIEARDYGIEAHPVNDGAEFSLSPDAGAEFYSSDEIVTLDESEQFTAIASFLASAYDASLDLLESS